QPLAACADRDALTAIVPPPADPAARAALAGLRARISQLKALDLAGKDDEYARATDAILADAEKMSYPPILAEALGLAAISKQGYADGKAAEALFDRALVAAARAHDDAQVAFIMTYLLRSIGLTQARPVDALALRPMAEAAVLRAGNPPRLRLQ